MYITDTKTNKSTIDTKKKENVNKFITTFHTDSGDNEN